MTRRYLLLISATLVAAVALSLLVRVPRRVPPRIAVPASVPVVSLALVVQRGAVAPEVSSAPRDCRVLLTALNRGRDTVRLSLAGYEDRLPAAAIAPGATWRGEFLADRPGEDFAWLVDGQLMGRFAVTGSHLLEGHR